MGLVRYVGLVVICLWVAGAAEGAESAVERRVAGLHAQAKRLRLRAAKILQASKRQSRVVNRIRVMGRSKARLRTCRRICGKALTLARPDVARELRKLRLASTRTLVHVLNDEALFFFLRGVFQRCKTRIAEVLALDPFNRRALALRMQLDKAMDHAVPRRHREETKRRKGIELVPRHPGAQRR